MTFQSTSQDEIGALASKLSHPAADTGDQPTHTSPKTELDTTDEDVQKALVDLVHKYEKESDVVRRHHVRRFLEAEEFWKGNQHILWSDRTFKFNTPFEHAVENGKSPETLPRYQYVTNIYQSLGLTVIAAISQRLPKVRFTPKSAKSERDIATARAASDVSELIEANNSLDMLSVRYAYLMWTQGIFGAYVRYVLDEDFGTHEVPQVQMVPVKIAEDRYECPACGTETPAADLAATGVAPDTQMHECPACALPLTDEHFRPEEMGEGPVISDVVNYPNGQEVISVYGGLNLKLMPHANSAKDSAYIILQEEQHAAALRAAYPKKASAIGSAPGPGPDAEFERNGRLALADAPPHSRNVQPNTTMVTYTRAWLRNWALWAIDDEVVRSKVLALYPKGVRVELAGDEFLAAEPENPDDCWEICSPMPGQGMYRESVGGSTISIQRRYNDAANVQAEHIEFGSAPPVFFDARYINREALEKRRMQPANFFPISPTGAPQQTDIAKLMFQPQLRIDSNIYQYGKDLVEMSQVISGAMPSLFGGSIQDVKTSSGYAQARAQSLGKLTLFWRGVKQFHARLMLKAVLCFKENRTDDVEQVVFGKSGEYSSRWIHLEDLKGNITAEPEADEDFPSTWAEIRDNIVSLVQQVPEMAQQILMHPANAPLLRKFIANPDLVLPMEDDREKQYREIDQMLSMAPTVDPMTGEPETSVLPDAFIDDHDAHVMTAREYMVSDEGMHQKQVNPSGYANIVLHVVAHYKAKAEAEAAIQQINAMTAQPQPQPGAPAPAGAPAEGGGGQSIGDAVEEALPGAGAAIDQLKNATIN